MVNLGVVARERWKQGDGDDVRFEPGWMAEDCIITVKEWHV
jgi:hypothetical protein